MKAYKGFDKNMQCRKFQYVQGGSYELDKPAELCRTGFHAVLAPLDVFNYYPPAESLYHEVELDDVDPKRESDSKVAGRKITVGVALGIPGLVKAQVEWALSNTDAKKSEHVKANRSAASSTGDQSAASSTGDQSAASSTGYRSAASSTGDQSAASSTGDRSAASSTGYRSAASSTGYRSAASSTGYQSAASSTGDQSAASSTGEESIAAVFGYGSKAQGAIGNWIVLTERDSSWRIVEVKAFKVDGSKILADTFYKLVGGKAVKA